MKKEILSILIISFGFIAMYGCGKADKNDSVNDNITTETITVSSEEQITTEITSEQKTEDTEEAITAENTELTNNDASSTDSVEERNVIKLENDGVNGKFVEADGMKKDPIITNKLLNQVYQIGDFELTVTGAQISLFTAQSQDVADLLSVEIDKECILVGIDIKVENKSDKDESINPEMSTIVTNTKEQANSLILLSDDVGGDFYGNVIKEGQVFFLCTNSDINELNHIKWRIDAPMIDGESSGDPLNIEFELIKD